MKTINNKISDIDGLQVNNPSTSIDFLRYGTIEFTLDGVQSEFLIPHGLGAIPSSANLTFSDGSNTDFIQGGRDWENDTNIIITCDTPPSGTIKIAWQVYR